MSGRNIRPLQNPSFKVLTGRQSTDPGRSFVGWHLLYLGLLATLGGSWTFGRLAAAGPATVAPAEVEPARVTPAGPFHLKI